MRQAPQGVTEQLTILDPARCNLGLLGPARLRHVAALQPQSAKPVPGQIDDGSTEIDPKRVRTPEFLKATEKTNECVLDYVLCRVLITGKQKCKAHRVAGVSPVEIGQPLLASLGHCLPKTRRAHTLITLTTENHR
jgi:hypothetical protein